MVVVVGGRGEGRPGGAAREGGGVTGALVTAGAWVGAQPRDATGM